MKQYSQREKTYILVLGVLVVILFSKSLWFDRFTPSNSDEIEFKTQVEKALENHLDGFFYDRHIFTYRIVDIGKVSETEARMISQYDAELEEDRVIILKGTYKAKVRKYLLGVLPIGQENIRLVDK